MMPPAVTLKSNPHTHTHIDTDTHSQSQARITGKARTVTVINDYDCVPEQIIA